MSVANIVWSAVLLGLLIWLLAGADSYFVYLGTTAVIASLLVLSAGVLAGDAGMFSLCQVSFAAVAALVLTEFASAGNPLPVLLECVLSVLTAGAFGVAVALPALRLRSVNLAVVTFGLANAVDVYISARGFPSNTVARPSFATSDRGYLIFASILVALVFVGLGLIRATQTGASWRSVRYSERATAALGVSVVRAKTTAFGVSAMIAGLAGVLTVLQLNTVSESTFPASQSLLIFAVAIFIGGWRWQGALLAGAMSVFIPYISNQLGISQAWGNILFAVGAIQALAGGSVADALWPRRSVRQDADAVPDFNPNDIAAEPTDQPSREPALEIRGLSVNYSGLVAVDEVSLSVPPQAIVGIIGANGAGKTTLIDAVSGYLRYSGQVLVDGVALRGLPQARARAGLRRTFQQDRVVPTITVEQYLRLAAGSTLPVDDLGVLLAFSGISSRHALVGEFEGASRRLLEVAAAFASRPRVVLLDEPVAGLSASEALEFADRLRLAPHTFGASVVLIEHDVDFVRAVCGHVIALDFGKVISSGTADAVLTDSAVTAAYLGEQAMAL
jgi:branched-chain amino acid transport system permease protein